MNRNQALNYLASKGANVKALEQVSDHELFTWVHIARTCEATLKQSIEQSGGRLVESAEGALYN